MSMGQQDIAEARTTAKQLAHRLIDDESFAQQVKSDPTGALTAAGLPEEAVSDFMRQFRVESDEVSGYADGCVLTCWIVTVTN